MRRADEYIGGKQHQLIEFVKYLRYIPYRSWKLVPTMHKYLLGGVLRLIFFNGSICLTVEGLSGYK